MISFVRGKLTQSRPTEALVDVGGIGYKINISLSTFEMLPEVGKNVSLLTHLQVKEDSHTLYGFWTEQERGAFRAIIGVSGIGPKMALAILSGISLGGFKSALIEGSTDVLRTIPGVGKKTAERLIVELRDKFGPSAITFVAPEGRETTEEGRVANDAMLALISLGYSRAMAHKAISEALKDSDGKLNVQELVRKALKNV